MSAFGPNPAGFIMCVDAVSTMPDVWRASPAQHPSLLPEAASLCKRALGDLLGVGAPYPVRAGSIEKVMSELGPKG